MTTLMVVMIVVGLCIVFYAFLINQTKVIYDNMPAHPKNLYHPINGDIEELSRGFSWKCFLFGFFWYLYKGMWAWGVIALILAFVTWGVSWLIFPFFANEQHAKSLLKRGYLNQKQWNEKKSGGNTQNAHSTQPVFSTADELAKLVALKDLHVLSDEEFTSQKKKLLS